MSSFNKEKIDYKKLSDITKKITSKFWFWLCYATVVFFL